MYPKSTPIISANFSWVIFFDLAGYTTRGEQKEVVDGLKDIDKDTVKTFLMGFQSTTGAKAAAYISGIGDKNIAKFRAMNVKNPGFFDQVMREYGFNEKEQVAKDIAGKLKDYLASQGRTQEAEKIQKILNNRKIYDEDIEDLDNIVKNTINYNY